MEMEMFKKFMEVMDVVKGMTFHEFLSVWCVTLEAMCKEAGEDIIEVADSLNETIHTVNETLGRA